MNNTTTLVNGTAEEIVLGGGILTALNVFLGIALPLGMLLEVFLIVKVLLKVEKRIWDVLLLALEASLAQCSGMGQKRPKVATDHSIFAI